MHRFLLSRLLQSIVVLWAIYTATFFLLMITPGDPFVAKEKQPPQAVLKALAEKYGLDYLTRPDRQQLSAAEKFGYMTKAYSRYLGALMKGDLGPSIEYENWSVAEIIRSSLPVSATLGAVALLIALWVGVAIGTICALTKNRLPDLALSSLSLLGVSLPSFVVGTLLLMTFAVTLPLFPPGGWNAPGLRGVGQIILPAITLALFYLAYIARLARASTLDTLHADFVRTAKAKGLAPRAVVTRHVGANAALPVLSFLGPAAAAVLTGSFVVEKLFAIPGLGTHFVNGCLNKDIPLVLGTVLTYSALVIIFNLATDVAYAMVDPRIRV